MNTWRQMSRGWRMSSFLRGYSIFECVLLPFQQQHAKEKVHPFKNLKLQFNWARISRKWSCQNYGFTLHFVFFENCFERTWYFQVEETSGSWILLKGTVTACPTEFRIVPCKFMMVFTDHTVVGSKSQLISFCVANRTPNSSKSHCIMLQLEL